MIPRLVQRTLHDYAQGYPVIALVGPRQAGKTTLARAAFPEKPYVSLENPTELARYYTDPEGFLSAYPEGAILDEVQRAPNILSYLQGIVDETKIMGMYVLTGSQQLGVMDGVSQSLAGRVALVEVLPFGRRELEQVDLAPRTLEDSIIKGAYPVIYDRSVDPGRWYADYLATYVQRDVRQVLRVRDLAQFGAFLSMCAAHVGQQINYQRWGADLGLDGKTLRGWFSVLEATYVTFRLRPHYRNFRKRVVKTPKLYFWDTGVASRLLDISHSEQLSNHPLRGGLVENWVITELLKGRAQRGLPGNLFYWRADSGLEIDVIAEHGITLQPIEIKSTTTAHPKIASSLQKWMGIAGDHGEAGTVVYTGKVVHNIQGINYLPWTQITHLAETI